MGVITAAVLTAALSWISNRLALRLVGIKAIVVYAPLIEEVAKTGIALILGSPVLVNHIIFGLIEGFYDAWGKNIKGLKAGLISFTGHTAYGLIAVFTIVKLKSYILAVLISYTVHLLWNYMILKFLVQEEGKYNEH